MAPPSSASSAQALRARGGYTVYLDYPVAGFAVDVVAQHGAQALAIACGRRPRSVHAPLPGEVSLDTRQRRRRFWSARAGASTGSRIRRWQREREQTLAEIDAMLGVEGDDGGDLGNAVEDVADAE